MVWEDFSAGTKEDWRDDADDFPDEALGAALGDWEGEVWLDVNDVVRVHDTVRLLLVPVIFTICVLLPDTCTTPLLVSLTLAVSTSRLTVLAPQEFAGTASCSHNEGLESAFPSIDERAARTVEIQ